MALVSWFVPEGFFWCCERACVQVQIRCEVSTWACKARKQTGKKQRDWKAARELQQSTAARVGRKEELYDTKCCTNCMTCPSLLNPPPVRPLGFSLWDAGLRRQQSGDHDASAKRVAQCLGSLPWHHKRPKAPTFLVSAWQRTPSAWALELDSCHVRRSHNIMAGVKVIIVRWMSLFPPTQPIITHHHASWEFSGALSLSQIIASIWTKGCKHLQTLHNIMTSHLQRRSSLKQDLEANLVGRSRGTLVSIPKSNTVLSWEASHTISGYCGYCRVY